MEISALQQKPFHSTVRLGIKEIPMKLSPKTVLTPMPIRATISMTRVAWCAPGCPCRHSLQRMARSMNVFLVGLLLVIGIMIVNTMMDALMAHALTLWLARAALVQTYWYYGEKTGPVVIPVERGCS
jgi:hypothetical protein